MKCKTKVFKKTLLPVILALISSILAIGMCILYGLVDMTHVKCNSDNIFVFGNQSYIDSFSTNVPHLYPLKTSENWRFFPVFHYQIIFAACTVMLVDFE